MNTIRGIKLLRTLHRGELAATETYQQAFDKIDPNEPGAADLRTIHDQHREIANNLRIQVRMHGGEPDRKSGVLGGCARFVEGTAKIFGRKAALKALRIGEQYGLRGYKKAIQDESLPDDSRQLIATTLLPQTEEHIRTLQRVMEC